MIADKTTKTQFKVKMMKIAQIIFLSLFILMAFALTALADGDNEEDESRSGSEETEEEGETEKESMPGFEIPFAIAGALVAARFLRRQ
jgi:PGF-CTERM protein